MTAWVKRFLHNLGSRGEGVERRKGALRRDEIAATEEMWIKACQEELKNDKSYQDLANKLKLEDRGGVLKCRGRLENSDLDMESQEPIILAKDHRLTKLLIEECHRKVHHGGIRVTLGELRSRFWVPKGRQVVKKVLRECVTYKKEQCKPFGAPPTAALPEFRVREAPEINYNEKTANKKRRTSWFSRYFGQSSRPSSGDLMKIRIVP